MTQTQIRLTERAAEHVRSYLQKEDNGLGLRIAVKPSGCSGYQYVIETAQCIGENDAAFLSNGIQIVVDNQSLRYLSGTELDYVREGLNEGFRFNNPHVQQTCGCGESFSVEE